MDSAELSELAADSGMEDLPSHGDGQQIVARLSSESKASPGGEIELSLDLTSLKLFAADDGRSMTAAAAPPSSSGAPRSPAPAARAARPRGPAVRAAAAGS